jgi:hypothetical protein
VKYFLQLSMIQWMCQLKWKDVLALSPSL